MVHRREWLSAKLFWKYFDLFFKKKFQSKLILPKKWLILNDFSTILTKYYPKALNLGPSGL